MKKCLWVVPKAIYPIRDGARVANDSLIKSIRPLFDQFDLLMFNEKDFELNDKKKYIQNYLANNVLFLKKNNPTQKIKKFTLLLKEFIKNPKMPVTTSYFQGHDREVSAILNNKYDYIIFDGLHSYRQFSKFLNNTKSKIIYRAHNVEGDLWSTAAEKTKNSIFSYLLNWQGQKMHRFEGELIEKSSQIWCISEEDKDRFTELYKESSSKMCLVPVALEFLDKDFSLTESNKINLLFLGKMDWGPNKDGLKWFLEEIWPSVKNNDLQLHLVGSGESSWLGNLIKQKGVKFHGFVNDVNPFYDLSDYSIIPIRYGSGTRIKVIESISKGLPIISTKMGVQGSGLNHYIMADDRDQWITILNNLSKKEGVALSESASKELKSIYSHSAIRESIRNKI